jgi:hypothetical protein
MTKIDPRVCYPSILPMLKVDGVEKILHLRVNEVSEGFNLIA